jgi:alpha-mannosidase
LGSQFHDILPGTSIPKAYEYAWNDEFIAANGFSGVLKSSLAAIIQDMNTKVQGRSLVVYNPVANDREDIVTAELDFQSPPNALQVYDAKGKAQPTQIIERTGNRVKFLFQANVPSVGLAVFDVRESTTTTQVSTLSISAKVMENDYYRVTFAPNGDLNSIIDKIYNRELLSKPAGLQFLAEKPQDYPAWNMDWKDRKKPAVGTMDEEAQLKIVENGPVRVTMEVTRKGRNSSIRQRFSLSAGRAGQRLEVDNLLDWQSTGVCLKAIFPLTASNPKATYNLGVGTIQRASNDSLKFEVPAKEWFDLSDRSNNFGVTILEDCKYGSDKPDDNTLRLTLMYTPETRNGFRYQNTQDWGIHQFRYGLYAHSWNWNFSKAPWHGQFFNRPLIAVEADQHPGNYGKELSLFKFSLAAVNIMAFKKMENAEGYIVRVQELFGKDLKNIRMQLPGTFSHAYEVNGQEQPIGKKMLLDKALTFDIGHYGIKSFAIFMDKEESNPIHQTILELPFDQDAVSYDSNRDDCSFNRRNSLPAELFPAEIDHQGIRFQMGPKDDRMNNVVACNGQRISIDGKYDKICILASALNDTKAEFKVDGKPVTLNIQRGTSYIGQFCNRNFAPDNVTVTRINQPFAKQADLAWFASHGHYAYPSRNEAYQYTYIYAYEMALPAGAQTLELPVNPDVKLFAATLVQGAASSVRLLQPLTDDFSQVGEIKLRNQ